MHDRRRIGMLMISTFAKELMLSKEEKRTTVHEHVHERFYAPATKSPMPSVRLMLLFTTREGERERERGRNKKKYFCIVSCLTIAPVDHRHSTMTPREREPVSPTRPSGRRSRSPTRQSPAAWKRKRQLLLWILFVMLWVDVVFLCSLLLHLSVT